MDPIISQLATTGPVGLIAAFLLWERLKERTERLQADKDRIETDKALSASLATLATTIQQVIR